MICKWFGWSWADLSETPSDVVSEAIRLIQEEQAELAKGQTRAKR